MAAGLRSFESDGSPIPPGSGKFATTGQFLRDHLTLMALPAAPGTSTSAPG